MTGRAEVDTAVVDAMARGYAPRRPPTHAERLVVIRFLAGRVSDATIGARIGRSERQVQRLRAQHGIAGQPRGTNRYTAGKNLP